MSCASLDSKYFAAAAAYLRGEFLPGSDDPDVLPRPLSLNDVKAWLDAMVTVTKSGQLHNLGNISLRGKHRVNAYNMEGMVLMVRMAGLLRSDKSIKPVFEMVGVMLGYPQNWLSKDGCFPTPSTLCKHRFFLDQSYNLLCRQRLRDWLDCGTIHICCLWDSSPRGGREWLLGELYIIRDQHLEAFVNAIHELQSLAGVEAADEHSDVDDLSIADRKAELAQLMHSSVWHLILPPVCLGARAMSLADKYAAALHTMRLLSDGWEMCGKLLKCFLGLCPDLGTESKLATVPEFDANQLYSHWDEGVMLDDVACDRPMAVPDSGIMSLRNCLVAAGCEHLCHNIEAAVTKGLPNFKEWFSLASNLGRFLNGKFYTTRMSRTIFNVAGAEGLNKRCQAFNEVPYENRFGTIIAFLDAIFLIKNGLRRYWDPNIFDSSAEHHAHEDLDETGRADIDKVTQAVRSLWFWSYGALVAALGSACEHIRNFSRGCPCHSQNNMVLMDTIASYRIRRSEWKKATGLDKPCSAKGMLAPEICSGAAMDISKAAFRSCRAMLMGDLDGVSTQERDGIMSEYDHGMGSLLQQCEFKFAPYEALPLRVCALAHSSQAKARQAMSWCKTQFQSTLDQPHHKVVKELFDTRIAHDELRMQMDAFIRGDDLKDLPVLKRYSLKLRCVRTNELSVERLHRLGSLEGAHATNYSEVFVSYQLRARDILSGPFAFPSDDLAVVAEKLRKPGGMMNAFSLHRHEAILEEQWAIQRRTGREKSLTMPHRMLRQIMYRSDSHSMFCGQHALKNAIALSKKDLKIIEDKVIRDPLADASSAVALPTVKVEALRCRYALKHFKDRFVSKKM